MLGHSDTILKIIDEQSSSAANTGTDTKDPEFASLSWQRKNTLRTYDSA